MAGLTINGLALKAVPVESDEIEIQETANGDSKHTTVGAILNIAMPVGSMIIFCKEDIPEGWLACENQDVSRTEYADLYSVIGDIYGAGDGSTTFTLPNDLRRYVAGVNHAQLMIKY